MSTVGGRLCFMGKRCPLAEDGSVLFKEGRIEEEGVMVQTLGRDPPTPPPTAGAVITSERGEENLGGRTGQAWRVNL